MRAQINRKNRIKEHVIRTNVEGSIDRYERGREHYKGTEKKLYFAFFNYPRTLFGIYTPLPKVWKRFNKEARSGNG